MQHGDAAANAALQQAIIKRKRTNGEMNKLSIEDRPAHDWYRFVLSYPPHLVRNYLEKFGLDAGQRVLDPFCGTGTTLVECKRYCQLEDQPAAPI